jgi:hypothetical protein
MTATPAVTRIKIVDDGYVLTVNGREVRVAPSVLLNKRRFRIAMLEGVHRIIDPPPREELNRLLAEAEAAR